jgi:hypothetical protein
MKNEQPLGFAIIEFVSSDDAEVMQARLHGHEIRENRTLSATFCVPGMSGPELYNKALNAVVGKCYTQDHIHQSLLHFES